MEHYIAVKKGERENFLHNDKGKSSRYNVKGKKINV